MGILFFIKIKVLKYGEYDIIIDEDIGDEFARMCLAISMQIKI